MMSIPVTEATLVIGAILAVVAVLYSSVGHGGASGYIAILALFSLPPEVIRPVALLLNVVVAGFATYRFSRAGLVDWKSAAPLVICSMPLAFIGGSIALPTEIYRPVLGVLLVLSAIYLIWRTLQPANAFEYIEKKVPLSGSIVAGSSIGLISGLSGIGGGVLLSPFFLVSGWAGARQTAGIAAVFIVANSMAGLAGTIVSLETLPIDMWVWAGMVFVGSLIGTTLGVRFLPVKPLIWMLAVAILISGAKFILV